MSTQMVGAGVRFDRIRRITGYLVGAVEQGGHVPRGVRAVDSQYSCF